jgi:hypothetical protein
MHGETVKNLIYVGIHIDLKNPQNAKAEIQLYCQ